MHDQNQPGNPYQPPPGSGRASGSRRRRWPYLVALLVWVPLSFALGFLVSIRLNAWPQFTGDAENVWFDARTTFFSGILFAFMFYVIGRIILTWLARRHA